MKKLLKQLIQKINGKSLSVLATLALVATTVAANSTCLWAIYQEELPDNYKELRKF